MSDVKAYLLTNPKVCTQVDFESFKNLCIGEKFLSEVQNFHSRYSDICIAAADLEKQMASVVFDFNYGVTDRWSEGVAINRISIGFISLLNLITSYHDQAKRIEFEQN